MGGVTNEFHKFAADFSQIPQIPNKTHVLYYMNQVTSELFLDVAQTCTGYVDNTQSLTFQCAPRTADVAENSEVCVECLQNAYNLMQSSFVAQKQTWNKNGAPYTFASTIDEQFEDFGEIITSCTSSCKTCDYEFLSQKSTVNFSESCKFNTQMVADLRDKVRGKFQETLYSQKDVAASLVQAVAGSNADNTIANVTDKAASYITDTLVNSIVSSVQVEQDGVFRSNGAIVYKGMQQASLQDQIAKIISKNKTYDQLLTSAQWNAWATQYTKDTTFDSVGNLFNVTLTSFSSLIENGIYLIMMILVFAVGAVALGLIIYLVIANRKKKKHKA